LHSSPPRDSLFKGLGVLSGDAAVNAIAADLEMYCINVERQNRLLLEDKVERVRRDLDKEREKYHSLTYRRRRVRSSSDNEEDSAGDVTSDKEVLDVYIQRQEKLAHDKGEELERLPAEEAEVERWRKQLLQKSSRNYFLCEGIISTKL
jgi:hypothetical protein